MKTVPFFILFSGIIVEFDNMNQNVLKQSYVYFEG